MVSSTNVPDWPWALDGWHYVPGSYDRWVSAHRMCQRKDAVSDFAVEIDRVANAYNLAEHHQDWETLVWLCHHAIAGRGPTEVQKYIELYGEEFAFVLYQWYIDNGESSSISG
jgi:hypothetical protein